MKFKPGSIKNRLKSCVCEAIKKINIIHKLDYDKIPIYLHDNVRLASCAKEADTVRWIEDFGKDDVVFDIGANVGAYSLIMAKYAGKIYAFEPSVFTFNTLVKNIYTNKAFNVVPLNMALSQRKKLGTFLYSSTDLGSSSNSFDGVSGGEVYKQEMVSYSIDEFIESFEIRSPNHIKLDVDGIEFEILKGALRTISGKTFKSLLVEASEQDDQMFSYLENLGLERTGKYYVGDSKIHNYLFTKKAK